MTVRVTRTFEFDRPPEDVWAFIADPEKRAGAISVVEEYEVDPTDDRKATWRVALPIPVIRSTVPVETEDVARDPPRYVKFVGRSHALRVTGEHTIKETEDGCRLVNEFVVDGSLPGVERFFKRNLDRELDNLERALRREMAEVER
ncbi:CoxG family protein [Haloprofundus salilacus]|uniref:CoxG family protein n=1 Tax=Haloprofundus salilacus TaxID=2876190 RepID=UPI001CC92182|nr:SRPBCC family protein [Haloprofundus salilacus]